jgi:phage terminase small subunit
VTVRTVQAPEHLASVTRKWWSATLRDYALQDRHVRLLTLAAEAWDRGQQAREAVDEHGLTYVDRFGAPRMRPEVVVERDSRLAFARLLKELDLQDAPAPDPRPSRRRS